MDIFTTMKLIFRCTYDKWLKSDKKMCTLINKIRAHNKLAMGISPPYANDLLPHHRVYFELI